MIIFAKEIGSSLVDVETTNQEEEEVGKWSKDNSRKEEENNEN